MSSEYRVSRTTPGVNWSSWTHTYHATYESAERAAWAFLAGKGRYRMLRSRGNTDGYAVIAKRRELPRRSAQSRPVVVWDEVATIAATDQMPPPPGRGDGWDDFRRLMSRL